jgi:hypothetical protein
MQPTDNQYFIKKPHKTLVFNDLCNCLVINELHFWGKIPRFSSIFTILS